MSLQSKVPACLNLPQAPKWNRANPFLRLTALPVVAIVLCIPAGPYVLDVLAKTGHQASSQAASDIDPDAIEALNKMGVYLRTLKSFQVQADITTDDVLDDGEIIQSSKKVDIVAARPNRFRAEVIGEDEHRLYFFDGKNFTIFGRLVNYYATVPAPPTIAELADQINAKYGIELPLLDLFQWGTNDEVAKRVKGGIDVGPREVDGVTCEQYAFHQEQIDWQIWIQLGEFPLPRKLLIRTLTDDARPQYSEKLTWNLAPSFSENAFTFDPPPDARRIPIAEVKAASGKNK
jgi:hypothetical protein